MSRPFRFGIVAAYTPSKTAWMNTARRAEELGYATLLIPDRMTGGIPALFPALAVAAAATTTLRVGSYVCNNEYRHPVILAREAATLDLLSDGRLELGLGAGVSADDFQKMGLQFPNASTRVGRLEESMLLLKKFFTEEQINFSGKYYTITDMPGAPRPVQKPYPPLLVAGAGERMLKLAAREANSIAIGSKISGRGPDPTDAPLEQKLTWIQEGAGERFAELELGQTIYGFQITDSPSDLPPQMGGWPIQRTPMTTAQAIELLLKQREQYGFSYLQVSTAQMENFAPIVEQLAGK